MTVLVEDYIRNLTAFNVTDGALANILVDAGTEAGVPVEELTERQKDLCTAYTYLWCSTSPLISGSVEDTDSGWSHREGGLQVSNYDKRLLRRMALRILAKYGIRPIGSTVRVTVRGIRTYPRRRK